MTLDEAWAAAEAVLPEGWTVLEWMRGFDDPWIVEVRFPFVNRSRRGRQYTRVRGEGATPAAALHDLAARLSAEQPETPV